MTAALLAGCSVVCACLGLTELAAGRAWGRRERARRRGFGGRRPAARPPGALGLAGVRLLAAAGAAVRPLARVAAPERLAARLAAAGHPGGLGVRELMAAKLAGALLGGAWGFALGAMAPGRLGIATTLAGPVAGFLAPDLWLERRAAERFRAARRELPALLDLFRVAVEAGLAPAAALGRVGERSSGPVGEAWRAASREVGLGVAFEDALAGVRARLPLPEVEAFCAALVRATRHGAPLGQTLAAQARDARAAERRRIQERAARAGPKIQLVVALLLVPSVLLLVAAALVSALVREDGSLVVGV